MQIEKLIDQKIMVLERKIKCGILPHVIENVKDFGGVAKI